MLLPETSPRSRVLPMTLRRIDGSSTTLRVRLAMRFWPRFAGLMLQRDWPRDFDALLLSGCTAVHTALMGLDIDVLYLDAKGCIVGVVETLQPWRISVAPRGGACHTVELPSGAVSAWCLGRGDQLEAASQCGVRL